jgi:hypothetical protein
MLVCLAVHWIALKTWFSADDFAWLGLRLQVYSLGSLFDVLFTPMAQGTVRTLSERLYFLVFSSLFGLNAAPFRIWTFLTEFACIALLVWIGKRLTGSRLAASLAAIFWVANAGLAMALDWSSAYNEICCAFFLLLAFFLFLRYLDTGATKYWILQWIVFVLGFGALELMVTYPALAAGYALCRARRVLRKTLYLFIPSIAFTALHLFYIPRVEDPNYKMHLDAGIPRTLWRYWAFALGAWRGEQVDWRPAWLGLAIALAISAALLMFVARKLTRREWLPLFLVAWFVIVILPVLPLQNHFTEYYVALPSLGVAMLAGWAFATSTRPFTRAVAIALASAYLVVSIVDIRTADLFFYNRARRLKHLITGLAARRASYEGKTVVIAGVDGNLFWSGFFDDPFRLIGIREIYLAPGSEARIEKHPEWGGIARFVTTRDRILPLIRHHDAVVYTLEDRTLNDVTERYQAILSAQEASERRDFADAGNPAYAPRFGAGWYPPENNFRWMARTAALDLGGPKSAGESLYLAGYCPRAAVAHAPLVIKVSVDGQALGSKKLAAPDQPFELRFPLPANLTGRYSVHILLELNRTTTIPPDTRPLGVIFGTFTIK